MLKNLTGISLMTMLLLVMTPIAPSLAADLAGWSLRSANDAGYVVRQ